MKRYYLAGPEVFWPDALGIGEQKKEICRVLGVEGCFPLDNKLCLEGLTLYQQGLSIFDENISLMRECDGVIANMTPFRGPSMDVGTAFEMGFMFAQGKPVYGYTTDHRLYSNRVTAKGEGKDERGFSIERFDMLDNLMLIGSIERSGGLMRSGLLRLDNKDAEFRSEEEASLALFYDVVKMLIGGEML